MTSKLPISSWFLLIAISVSALSFISACSFGASVPSPGPYSREAIMSRAYATDPLRLCDGYWVYRDPLTKRLATDGSKLIDAGITDPKDVCS